MESENFIGPVQGDTIKAKNFFERLGGVFFSPEKAFSEIGSAPRLLISVIAAVSAGVLSNVVIMAVIANKLKQLGSMMEQPVSFIPLVILGVMNIPLPCLIFAAYGKIFSMITGAENRYKILFDVSLYAMIAVNVVSAVLTAIVLQIKAPMSIEAYKFPDVVYSPNLGALIETVAGNNVLPELIINLAEAADIFNIWIIVLLSIGFSAVSTKLKTATAAMWLGGIYVIFHMINAVIRSAS